MLSYLFWSHNWGINSFVVFFALVGHFKHLFTNLDAYFHSLRLSFGKQKWDLHLCFSQLTFDSSVDKACFLMKGSLIDKCLLIKRSANTVCIFCMGFECNIYSICADFVLQKLLFFCDCTMPCAYQSKFLACMLRTWVQFATEWKKKWSQNFKDKFTLKFTKWYEDKHVYPMITSKILCFLLTNCFLSIIIDCVKCFLMKL